jgi:hypothetical protein
VPGDGVDEFAQARVAGDAPVVDQGRSPGVSGDDGCDVGDEIVDGATSPA